VHVSEAGLPILGDTLYGKPPGKNETRLREAADAIGRQALHAAVLGFTHPATHERLRFETPPPEDFQRALRVLRE
jgi:23S rRNA pseudouridine1911/1915/1917 synthase